MSISHPSLRAIGIAASPTTARRLRPETYSIAMNGTPSASPTSKIATALGCEMRAAARAITEDASATIA